MSTTVHILLPVHNRREITGRFLDCLSAQTYADFHLILIDDGSTDGTEAMARGRFPHLTVIKGNGDWWWAGSLQQGIDWLERHQIAGSDIVLMINDDVLFGEDFLNRAITILNEMPDTLFLPMLVDAVDGGIQESGVEADLVNLCFKPATSKDRINCLPTRGLFMRMADLRRIGSFHPQLLPHYWSDYEFTIRAAKKGLRLMTSAEVTLCTDREQTGFRSFDGLSFWVFLRRFFSKKSVLNPIYHSSFILLTTPMPRAMINVGRVWRGAFMALLRHGWRSVRDRRERIRLRSLVRRARGNLKVILGAGSTVQRDWISTNYPILDITDGQTFDALFAPESVSNFFAEHVWEHLSSGDGLKAACNCVKYLRGGGRLRIAVPDGFHPNAEYLAEVKPGGCGPGADDHKVLYDYRTITRMLEKAGYVVDLLEWFDENGQFHQKHWDIADGMVVRSAAFDSRNGKGRLAYTSLIVDAINP